MALGGIAKEQDGAEAIMKVSLWLNALACEQCWSDARCSCPLFFAPSKTFLSMILRYV
jgi:hypothetical protein